MFSNKIYFEVLLFSIHVMTLAYCLDVPGFETFQKGKLDIQFKRIEECKNRGSGEVDLDLHLKRISRTKVNMEGNITYKVDVGDDFKIVFELSSWGNGGWRSNAYRYTVENACSGDSVVSAFFKSVHIKAGIPTNKCPVPAKRYELKDFDTTMINNLSLPVYIISTMWRVYFSYYEKKSNKCFGCKAFIVESKVKKSSR